MKQNNTGYMFCLFHRNLFFRHTESSFLEEIEKRHVIGNDFYFSKNLTFWQFRWLSKLENNEICYLHKTKKGETMNILSIDAWGNNKDGYEWNNWFKAGTISKEDFEKLNTNRKLIKYMRDEGFLSDCSKGKISIEDFIKKEAGSIGVFMVDPCDKNRFQSVIHSYTKNRKTERKINIKFFPIVIDGFEIVKHIYLVEIMK